MVIITSVMRPHNAYSIFSADERFQQLLQSIQSARLKIPNAFVVVIEGSSYTEDQTMQVKNSGADQIVHIDVDAFDKQCGEIHILLSFLRSDIFINLHRQHQFLTFNKLSGRYVLTERFLFSYDGESCICKFTMPENSYSGHGYCYTRYYSIPIKYLDNFVRGLEECAFNIFKDVEHSFYRFQVIPLDKIDPTKQTIHLVGCLAPTGQYIED